MICESGCGYRASFLILDPPLPITASCLTCWFGWRLFTDAAWMPILTRKESMAYTTLAPVVRLWHFPVPSGLPKLTMMAFTGFCRLDSLWPRAFIASDSVHTPIYDFCLRRFWPLIWGNFESLTWDEGELRLMLKATEMKFGRGTIDLFLSQWESRQ